MDCTDCGVREVATLPVRELGFRAFGRNVCGRRLVGRENRARSCAMGLEKKIAVVSMMDVLEHMPYPKKILNHLHSKLEDGGCLIISMPNKENIIWYNLIL